MLRETANSLYRYLIGVFPVKSSYALRDLHRSPMPSLVAHYLEQELKARVESGLGAAEGSLAEWVKLDHPDVRSAEEKLLAAMQRHVQAPASAWSEMLREAVQQVLAHLVHPVHTLVEFAFEGNPGSVWLSEVQRRMGFFAAYPYLDEVVRAYAEQKRVREIDRERLAAVLSRSDRELTREYDARAWMRLLAPLFELIGTIPDREGAGVPVELLRSFFVEKEADQIRRALDRVEDGTSLDERKLERLIEEALSRRESAEASERVIGPRERPVESSSPKPASGESRPVPLWQQFQQKGSVSRPIERSTGSAPKAQSAPEDSALPLWMRYRSSESAAPPPEASSLEKGVLGEAGAKNREVFIRHLFAGSTSEYEAVLRRLRGIETWTEASQVIAQEVFRKNQVNIYSEPAVAFTNAIEERYRRRP